MLPCSIRIPCPPGTGGLWDGEPPRAGQLGPRENPRPHPRLGHSTLAATATRLRDVRDALTGGACWWLVRWDGQEYNVTKKSEHMFKSLMHDGDTVSAVNPDSYAHRMRDFLKEVFY